MLGPAPGLRGGAPPGALPQQTAAQHAVTQSLLAAKESEAALLRQQLHQLTADFKFNLKVCCRSSAAVQSWLGAVVLIQMLRKSFCPCFCVHMHLLPIWAILTSTHPPALCPLWRVHCLRTLAS